jgi:D-alanyl-D-alanine carboxypeptidase
VGAGISGIFIRMYTLRRGESRRTNRRGIHSGASLVVAIVLLLCTTLLASCGKQYLPQAQVRAFEREVNTVIGQARSPGAVIGLWTPQGDWVWATGKSDLATQALISAPDRYRIGSMTMMFTGTVVLQLVQEKKLSLADTLDKYHVGVPGANRITLKMLLNHTSGIFDYTATPKFAKAFQANPLRRWTSEELVRLAAASPPYFAPGKGWQFSNTNYVLLGMIVEQVTGHSLAAEMNSRVLKKVRLKSSYLAAGPDIKPPFFNGYWDPQGDGHLQNITRQDMSWAWAAGAVVSNLYDMKPAVEALAKGTLLDDSMQEQRLTVVRTNQKQYRLALRYGLGISKVGKLVGLYGSVPGYGSAAYYLPDKNVTVVVCMNIDAGIVNGSADEMVQRVLHVLYPKDFRK